MKRILIAAFTVSAVAAVQAQPVTFTDLGAIVSTTSVYSVPDRAVGVDLAGSAIRWFRFDIPFATSGSGFYLDIDVFATSATGVPDTEIGVYNNVGGRIADDDDDGHSLRSALTFGNTTARTMPADPFGFTNGLAHNGRDGNLGVGRYWLAMGQFNTTYGATNWNVTSTGTGSGTALMNFRTDAPVPEPASILALSAGAAALLRRRRKA